jgi:hypothetical protein
MSKTHGDGHLTRTEEGVGHMEKFLSCPDAFDDPAPQKICGTVNQNH